MFHERPLFACLFFSILALSAALIAEFAFGIAPCILCLGQRVPHILAIILICLVITLKRFYRVALMFLVAFYLGGAILGVYQVGVEQAWWGIEAPSDGGHACTASSNSENIETLYESMSGTAMSDCAHPAFSFYGITFAGMNALLCLCLMGIAIYGVHRGQENSSQNEI